MQVLRDYQLDVVERARQRIREGAKRVLIQSATGGGKGSIAAHLLARAEAMGKRSLFLVHRRRLVQQMADRVAEYGGTPGVIMSGYARTGSRLIQLASRDTLCNRAFTEGWMNLPPADLVILDEAHQSGQLYDRLIERYKDSVLIGMTATPMWPDGRGMGEVYEALEQTVPTSQLVREGYLCPVRCFAPQGAMRAAKEGKKRKLAGDPVRWWKHYGEGRPTVLFAGKCEQSRHACELFNAAGVVAEHIDAHTPDKERDNVLDRVAAGTTKIVCSVGTLALGVDVPPLSCAILLRAVVSCVTCLQLCGRILRPSPGKSDCVIIDHASAIVRHGFPDEDYEWTLDAKDTVQARIAKNKKEGKSPTPIICPACDAIFRSSMVCPNCGHVLQPKRDRGAVLADDVLVEVSRGRDPEQSAAQLRELQNRTWKKIIGQAANSGRKARAAACMFKQEFGTWPDRAGMSDCPRGCQWDSPAAEVWPNYVGKKRQAALLGEQALFAHEATLRVREGTTDG